jgi:hypothetical protein
MKSLKTVIEHPWKYVVDAPRSVDLLFDLEDDPGERRDRLAGERERALALRGGLRERLGDLETDVRELAPGELDPAMRDRLRALGYVD